MFRTRHRIIGRRLPSPGPRHRQHRQCRKGRRRPSREHGVLSFHLLLWTKRRTISIPPPLNRAPCRLVLPGNLASIWSPCLENVSLNPSRTAGPPTFRHHAAIAHSLCAQHRNRHNPLQMISVTRALRTFPTRPLISSTGRWKPVRPVFDGTSRGWCPERAWTNQYGGGWHGKGCRGDKETGIDWATG